MSTLKDGSHIKVFRGYYYHHGIYIAGNQVIHYDGNPFSPGCICECSLEYFADGGTIEIVTHDNGHNPDDVIRRARSRLKEKEYDLLFNNCEHFANWCAIGKKQSQQISTYAVVGAKTVATVAARKYATKIAFREATPWLLAADAAEIVTSQVAESTGAPKETATTVGQTVGLGASVGIGAAIGGPIGAAVGAGFWGAGLVVEELFND
ncbi:MAG: lecithin retinol acyltransferase family protein [Pseudomonadota bacterium]